VANMPAVSAAIASVFLIFTPLVPWRVRESTRCLSVAKFTRLRSFETAPDAPQTKAVKRDAPVPLELEHPVSRL
jgi:hypothetical protein